MDKMACCNKMNPICAGLLAHVDAGKTTLAESILYVSGAIMRPGRVDHKDAHLDTYELERSRGITIFSKQAEVVIKGQRITLLDTPGHVDFSAEMERTLSVLDYGILVIDGNGDVTGHVFTLWRLLKAYHIPVFCFINKMDKGKAAEEEILTLLQEKLNPGCLDFSKFQGEMWEASDAFLEQIAMRDDFLLEKYLEGQKISEEDICSLIMERKIFPCYFGSALKLQGVEAFLEGFIRWAKAPAYPERFGAKVYKITRDRQGMRLTHLKITGGTLSVKDMLKEGEKADQIRIYSGDGCKMVSSVSAGEICAVTGPATTFPGEGLGEEVNAPSPLLEPVLTYKLILPEGEDPYPFSLKMKELEEENPQLSVQWEEETGELSVKVMGQIQIEILKHMISERFHVNAEFGTGKIVYKETIKEAVEGAGHFEPLRHYAEVRLLLEPLQLGSGLVFSADCSEDVLDKNWQRLILTHLSEKKHKGVLVGGEITDMKITLIGGRAHIKHTEGGDFRQATYRALRQGLKKSESLLLEPVYEFLLEVPKDAAGRAMSDIQRMYGSFTPPEMKGDTVILTGQAPVATMRDYPKEVRSYTRGLGRIYLSLKGYAPCHNQEEVILSTGYDSESDLHNPTGSVFCDHGAGFFVSWDHVEEFMHTKSPRSVGEEKKEEISQAGRRNRAVDEDELIAIFEKTYGPIKRYREKDAGPRTVYAGAAPKKAPKKKREPKEEILLVDGYNILFAWEDLKELAKENLEAARGKLMDILCNYQGSRDITVLLVFDGYKVPGNPGEMLPYHNIQVVYTKEGETADQYIEKYVPQIVSKYYVRVATSDGLEQRIILGEGAHRITARELLMEVAMESHKLREEYLQEQKSPRQYLLDGFEI